MSKVEVVMPQLGESLTEGTIVKWHKKPGDKVRKDETLLEISTDKVDSEIPSPATGVVVSLLFEEQKTVPVRQVIAVIETDASAAVIETPPPAPAAPGAPVPKAAAPAPAKGPAPAAVAAPAKSAGARFYSPLVLSIAREEGISMSELEEMPGTGENGRVTKKDILAVVEQKKKGIAAKTAAAQAPATGSSMHRVENTLKHIETAEVTQKYPAGKYEVLQMSNIIHKMAEHMVKTVQTSPHVWAIHEVDMTKVDHVRRANAKAFEEREGFKLTYTPFVCDAVIQALKEFPLVNSSIDGDKIILKRFVNLGIAVASDNGLIVPVIKNAEEKNFVGLARAVNDIATRARMRRLTPADIEGGSFTITNYGVFGTKTGVPLINQPQVAILGTGTIGKRPVVINDGISIRMMADFTLAFDHRIIDGALAGYFVEAVIKVLESYDEKRVM
jgi:2-oxoglutarate dehydrogenase E2 component (dihydrolipoamide succinyltransferase)